MLEIICVCGSNFKMMHDASYIAEKWIEVHEKCLNKGDVVLFSDTTACALTGVAEHINIFTGEQIEL